MTRTIWKFTLNIADRIPLRMPEGAEILAVKIQTGTPQLWAIVDPAAPIVTRWFELRGTGHPLGQVGAFIDTFHMNGGCLVFHLFDSPPAAERGLTDVEKKSQAGRCGCRGSDDLCPCQNAPDRATRAEWATE